MGLAASFRHTKERDKVKDEEKVAKKTKGKEGKERLEVDEEAPPNSASLVATPSTEGANASSSHGHSSGWSWILEEWYCNGLGQRGRHSDVSASASAHLSNPSSMISSEKAGDDDAKSLELRSVCENLDCMKSRDQKKKEKKFRKCCCTPKESVGPYELLVKERLMGIYMAVFIYRDLKPLVRGERNLAVKIRQMMAFRPTGRAKGNFVHW